MFSAALATPGWRAQLGIAAQFALFGALHAAALVLSIRACAGVAAGALDEDGSAVVAVEDTTPVMGNFSFLPIV